MGGGPSYPAASQAERALQSQQLALLNQQLAGTQEQQRIQNLLAPIMYQQAGLIPQYGQVPGGFDEQWYLANNADVQQFVRSSGGRYTASDHYYMFGKAEGRPGAPGQQGITGFSQDPRGTPEQRLFEAQSQAALEALNRQQQFERELAAQNWAGQLQLQGQVLNAQQAQAAQAAAATRRLEELQSTQFGQQMSFAQRTAEQQQQMSLEQLGLQREVISGQRAQTEFAQKAFEQQMKYLEEQGALTRQEVAMLTEQQRLQGILTPIQLEAAGYLPQYDPQGRLSGVSRRPKTEMELIQEEIQSLTGKRTLAALKGELPVDPALTRNLAESERNLRENLRKQLGPGYETSSPGIEAMARFEEGKNAALYAARTGDINLAGTLGLNLNQQSMQQQGLGFQRLLQAGSAPLGTIAATAQGIASIPTLAPSFAGIQQYQIPSGYGPGATPGVGGIPQYSMFAGAQPGSMGSPAYNMGLIGSAAGFPYQGLGNLGSLAQLYSIPIGQREQERAYQYQDAYNAYKGKAGLYGALIGSALGIAGSYFGQSGAQMGWQSGQAIGMAIA